MEEDATRFDFLRFLSVKVEKVKSKPHSSIVGICILVRFTQRIALWPRHGISDEQPPKERHQLRQLSIIAEHIDA